MPQARLFLLYSMGALVANERIKLWLKLCEADVRASQLESRWQLRDIKEGFPAAL